MSGQSVWVCLGQSVGESRVGRPRPVSHRSVIFVYPGFTDLPGHIQVRLLRNYTSFAYISQTKTGTAAVH